MKKQLFVLLGLSAVIMGGWSLRPAFNRPTGFTIGPLDPGYKIPPAYCTHPVGGAQTHQCRYSGLANKGYSHVGVINLSPGNYSIVTSESATAPDSASTEKLYVASGGTAYFDDLSIFNYLYIQSETNASVSTGRVMITVW